MNRTQLTLGGLLILQVVLIAAFRSPFAGAAAAAESELLFPALADMTPARLEIDGAAPGEKVELVKGEGGWHVESATGFPADGKKVGELVETLKKIKVRRPVVSSSRYHETFKVEDEKHEGRLRLWSDASGDPQVDLILGSSPNYRTTHVRRSGQDAVYEVHGIASYDVRADREAWIEKELVGLTEDRVTGLTLTNAQGSFELARQEGQWTVVSPSGAVPALDQAKVAELIRTVASLRLTDAAGVLDESAQGLASPAATVVVRFAPAEGGATASAEELTLRIGGMVPESDSKRYVAKSGLGFAGTVWDSSVSGLLEQKLDTLRTS